MSRLNVIATITLAGACTAAIAQNVPAAAAVGASAVSMKEGAFREPLPRRSAGESRHAATTPDASRADAPASAGAGQVFGIFAGISVYPTGTSLPACASDAGRAYEIAHYSLGMREDHASLLTETTCTKRNIEQAINRFSRMMDDNDTLIVFYSGHGGQKRASRSSGERDRTDETLALMNTRGTGTQDMTDNDMADALANVTRGHVVLVLDSCFSGGFADDVVTDPSRLGLFACTEQQVAQVAMDKQAGGYLSAYFISAIGAQRQAADANHDRTITAGELSAFIRSSFRGERGLEQDVVVADDRMQDNTPLFSW